MVQLRLITFAPLRILSLQPKFFRFVMVASQLHQSLHTTCTSSKESCRHIHVYIIHIEAKIYSQTNIFSDCRLQRYKRGNNSARSSQQQFKTSTCWNTWDYCSMHGYKIQHITFSRLLLKGKTIVLALPLALHTIPWLAAIEYTVIRLVR